jgi:hypothetical protein
MAAFDPATLDRWRALAIVDRDGATVGTVNEFYLDRETGHPTWALVSTGLFGATQTFVPLVHATEIDDGLQVPYEKRHIKDTPQVDPHDELTPDEEATLFAHYGVDYHPSTTPDPGAGSGEPPGPVLADPESAGSAEAEETGPGLGGAVGTAQPDPSGAVPAEPEPIDPAGTASGSDEATGPVPTEPGTVEPDVAVPPGPDADTSTDDQRREEPNAAEPDLSRPAPVEPGLPGSTSATTSGLTPPTIDHSDPTDAAARPAGAPQQAPGDTRWPPAVPEGFGQQEPADRPTGASDRWREAKLAAERDRIARAAAAQPEERSPLERARRRLERLVGGGQEPAEPEPIPDRDTAERARRARLGLDEDDPRSR